MNTRAVLGILFAAVCAAAPSRDYGNLPLAFEENRGQTDARVRYLVRSSDHTLFLTNDGAVLRCPGSAIRLRWRNANRTIRIEGLAPTGGASNYLGPHAVSGIPHFARVRYRNVWPGIDAVFYGTGGRLEYDLVLAPGADPRSIQLEFEGASPIRNEAGDLVLQTASGEFRQRAPAIYQDGRRVTGSYVVRGQNVRFAVGAYDRRRTLIIDPELSYLARFGARPANLSLNPPFSLLESFNRGGNSIAVDAAGNAYVVGSVFTADFPTTPGAFQQHLNDAPSSTTLMNNDVFIMKLNPTGSALVYSTFLGGTSDDLGKGIAIDADGNAYVCGLTLSTDFPIAQGILKNKGSGYTGFVAKLNATGSALLYSTYLGGILGFAEVRAIAVDSARSAYVTGWTNASDFPVTPGAFRPPPAPFGAVSAAFVTKINAAGSGLVYSTFLGQSLGSLSTVPPVYNSAIAVDAAGNAYIGGSASSSLFPTTPGAFQTSVGTGQLVGGEVAGFVSKLNPDGSALVFSTFLGASGDGVDALALGPDGSIYVTGHTVSGKFPTTPGSLQPAVDPAFPLTQVLFRWPPYGFVTRLKPDGSGLIYSTYIGGGGAIVVSGIAVDGVGNAFVAGSADSPTFRTTPDSIQPCLGDSLAFSNAFLMELDPAGSRLLYSTFLGGTAREQGFGLALDKSGNAYVTGMSDSTDFDPTPGAAGITVGQAFIAKVNFAAPNPFGVSCVANAASMTAGPVAAGEIVTIFGNGLGPAAPLAGAISGGVYDTILGGTQVLFDGVPAPLLMVQSNQVNAIVPSGVRFRAQTTVQVSINKNLTPPVTLDVVSSSPAIFSLNGRGAGPAAVLNQDGTINSAANPADRGSIISIFANSFSPWFPALGDGLVLPNGINQNFGAQIQISGLNVGATYPYAGNAPGEVSALWQINVRIPTTVVLGPFVSLRLVTAVLSQRPTLTIAVK